MREKICEQRLRYIFWFIAIVLGVFSAWNVRHTMNPDGVSYLDMGDAYVRGDWKMAFNGYWSPLYSWFLGLVLYLFKPSTYWEFATVHLINFLIYLIVLISFQFFMRELLYCHQLRKEKTSEEEYVVLPYWMLLVLGYTLFIWSSLSLIGLSKVTPDLCNAALVYMTAGILLRLKRQPQNWSCFIGLGIIAGFSYLARTAMLPLSFIFLLVAVLLSGRFKRAIVCGLIAAFCFLLVAGPYIIALSLEKNRFTVGDTGKVVYGCWVNNVPCSNWQGNPPGYGTPKHPTRKIFDNPEVYEFSVPIGGTYPLWYDLTYWVDGMVPHFNLKDQVKALGQNLELCYRALSVVFVYLISGFLIICFIGRRRLSYANDICAYWFLVVPSVVAISMFLLLFVQTRYIGVFIVLFWIGLFSGLRVPDTEELRKVALFVGIVTVLQIWISVVPSIYSDVRDALKREGPLMHLQWRVADGLSQRGVQRGDKVAVVGLGYDAYWARLARVKIVAEIAADNETKSWIFDDSVKHNVFERLRATGAKVIVARDLPRSASDWRKIGDTDYYVYFLESRL
jgi:hypothetical protein